MGAILKKYWLGALIALLFVTAAFLIYVKLHPPVLPENLIQGTGRIDGDLINLNAKYPGRVAEITAEEGSAVRPGEMIARIDSREYVAQKEQLQGQIEAKREELDARTIELSIQRKNIPHALLKARSVLEMKLRSLEELEQNIHLQKANLEQSERDYERSRDLVGKRLIEDRALETAALKRESDRDQLKALELKRLQLAETITIARSELSEASAAQDSVAALEASRRGIMSGIKSLEASKSQIEAILDEMVLRSPLEGFVVETIAHKGEVVGAGSPVATLIDPKTLYLKIFVDTLQNGRIKIGDRAVIFLDAAPDRPIEAKVARIEQKAEFTPKEVSVASDRIQRVFAVHLRPLKPDPLLKLGIPAVGVVSTDGMGLPLSLRDIPE